MGFRDFERVAGNRELSQGLRYNFAPETNCEYKSQLHHAQIFETGPLVVISDLRVSSPSLDIDPCLSRHVMGH
jgi:hypothetical protein